MFSSKRNIEVKCSSYINLYKDCNICCQHCKFQITKPTKVLKSEIDFSVYKDQRVLFCYSVDPYPYGYENTNNVREAIKKLHNSNCSIVFLTRRAEELYKDLDCFNKEDYIGISLSENCLKNSSDEDVKRLYEEATKRGLNTWMSLEPVYSSEYANEIINKFGSLINFIRIGKDDLKEYDWETEKSKITKKDNVYIK